MCSGRIVQAVTAAAAAAGDGLKASTTFDGEGIGAAGADEQHSNMPMPGNIFSVDWLNDGLDDELFRPSPTTSSPPPRGTLCFLFLIFRQFDEWAGGKESSVVIIIQSSGRNLRGVSAAPFMDKGRG
uniref:Uncharacterized protein n=1 Tax=Globodera rostochiensis TaxID=31243 RepID=A0A914HF93_GLORO